jgi:hypothetical protein
MIVFQEDGEKVFKFIKSIRSLDEYKLDKSLTKINVIF